MKYKFLRFPDFKTKAVTLSYDDGSRSDLKLVEILNKYSLKCTFNIVSGFMGECGDDYFLSPDEIRDNILKYGHEAAIHGEFHRALGKQSALEGIKDVLNCRLALEKKFGGIIRGMAYADSGINAFHGDITYCDIRHYLCDLGIAYARTVDGDNDRFELPEDFYRWNPTSHHANPKIYEYIEKFKAIDVKCEYSASRTPRLFFLWGHSSELERADAFDEFDKICSLLSSINDVWYATNIEICDYVSAYNSLIFNAEGTFCFNPTSQTVFFNIDGRDYRVGSGETVCTAKK